MELFKVNGRLNGKRLAVSMLVPVAGGLLIGWLSNKDTQQQYAKLEEPDFSPPPALFPIVWTGLYAKMGIARFRIAEKAAQEGETSKGLVPYNVQLGLNFLWSFLFFKLNLRGTALIEVMVLLGAILLSAYKFQQGDALAGLLLTPYAAWVGFASLLNYSIWSLNRS